MRESRPPRLRGRLICGRFSEVAARLSRVSLLINRVTEEKRKEKCEKKKNGRKEIGSLMKHGDSIHLVIYFRFLVEDDPIPIVSLSFICVSR